MHPSLLFVFLFYIQNVDQAIDLVFFLSIMLQLNRDPEVYRNTGPIIDRRPGQSEFHRCIHIDLIFLSTVCISEFYLVLQVLILCDYSYAAMPVILLLTL